MPARIAVDSLNFLCVVNFPLLKLSLSIHGKSSCINEYACIHSTAAATCKIFFLSTSNIDPISKSIFDLTFLPPGKSP